MPQFTTEGRLRGLPDIQRSFLWDLTILNFDFGDSIPEDLTLRAKTVSIPGRTIEPIETWFYGAKSKFSGRTTFTNQVTVQFEETEDQKVMTTFYKWMQQINNANPKDVFATLSPTLTKKQYTKDMYLTLYRYNGEEVRNKIRFFNTFPESIPDISLDMAGNESVKFDVTFSFDYWLLEGPDK